MEEHLFDAREELKRLEHIIYVSLKYTRTVDVLLNALNRMVSTSDLIIRAFALKAIEDGKLVALPKSNALTAKRIAAIHEDDPILNKYLTFYAFLKNILKLPFGRRQEYRRHVTHIVKLENATSEIKIDNLENAEKFMHEFLKYSYEKLIGKLEEDNDEWN